MKKREPKSGDMATPRLGGPTVTVKRYNPDTGQVVLSDGRVYTLARLYKFFVIARGA